MKKSDYKPNVSFKERAMKKIFTFLMAFSLTCIAFGQTYFLEDFNAGVMPPEGWTIDTLADNWTVEESSSAGGIAPEAVFSWSSDNTISRFISPVVDLSGLTSVTMMLNFYYYFYDDPAPSFGIATRSGSGPWTTVWEITPTGDVGPKALVVDINNSDLGADFQFCLYVTGDFYNINYLYFDNIQLFNPLATNAVLTSASLPRFAAIDSVNSLTGSIQNMGTDTIKSFDVLYSINGGTPEVSSVTGINLAIGDAYNFLHNKPIVFNTPGNFQVDVVVNNINGGVDQDTTNNYKSLTTGVVPWIPNKKVFCEEATGTWCGWCVRGICFMEYMAETYPETWIGAAVHNGDPMVNDAYDEEMPNIIPNFPGYPSGTIDRAGANYWDPSDFELGYQQRIKAISPGSVQIVNFSWDTATRIVTFDIISEILLDISDELRFGAVIIEDSLYGTGGDWDQANYYSGGGNGEMCGFETLADPVPAADMHYDHVAREILDTPYGTEGSIPAPVTAGSFPVYSYTYTIPTTWNFDKLHFVALLIDYTTGEILNANDDISWVGIPQNNHEIGLKIYPNPVSSNTTINFKINQPQTVSIRVTDLLGRVVFNPPAEQYPAGENKIMFNAENMNDGLYVVEVNANGKKYTQKISVIK